MSRSKQKPDTWMPWFIGDYLRDTTHLSTTLHGAYCLLLMGAWSRKGYLPNDDEQLAAMAKMSPVDWKKAAKVIRPFFMEWESGLLVHKRLAAEYEKAVGYFEQQQEKSQKGVEARKKKAADVPRGTQPDVNPRVNPSVTHGSTSGSTQKEPEVKPNEQSGNNLRSTPSPSPSKNIPTSSGAAAPPTDPVKDIFDRGVRLLGGAPSARSFLGKLRKDYGDPVVISAIAAGEEEVPSDPAAWLTATCQTRAGTRTPVAGKQTVADQSQSDLDQLQDYMGKKAA